MLYTTANVHVIHTKQKANRCYNLAQQVKRGDPIRSNLCSEKNLSAYLDSALAVQQAAQTAQSAYPPLLLSHSTVRVPTVICIPTLSAIAESDTDMVHREAVAFSDLLSFVQDSNVNSAPMRSGCDFCHVIGYYRADPQPEAKGREEFEDFAQFY